jgi:hypothetical protein
MNFRERVLMDAYSNVAAVLRARGMRWIRIVETGTARSTDESYHELDGWSTLTLARCCTLYGGTASFLYSIDINPEHIKASKEIVPKELHPHVRWLLGNSLSKLRLVRPRIDLLYLDSADDPDHILKEFKAARSRLRSWTMVVIDDCEAYDIGPMGKGSLLIPFLQGRLWQVDLKVPTAGKTMAVARWGERP